MPPRNLIPWLSLIPWVPHPPKNLFPNFPIPLWPGCKCRNSILCLLSPVARFHSYPDSRHWPWAHHNPSLKDCLAEDSVPPLVAPGPQARDKLGSSRWLCSHTMERFPPSLFPLAGAQELLSHTEHYTLHKTLQMVLIKIPAPAFPFFPHCYLKNQHQVESGGVPGCQASAGTLQDPSCRAQGAPDSSSYR